MCIPPHGLLVHIHYTLYSYDGMGGRGRFVLLDDHQKAYNHKSSRGYFDALGEILSPDTA